MIELHFKSKRPVLLVQPPWPVVYTGSYHKAKKLGITLAEYNRRVGIVKVASEDCPWKVGDLAYPYDKPSYEEHGSLRVIGIVSHYDNYGDVEWNEHPYILAVRPEKAPNSVVTCTYGWALATPKYEIESC